MRLAREADLTGLAVVARTSGPTEDLASAFSLAPFAAIEVMTGGALARRPDDFLTP